MLDLRTKVLMQDRFVVACWEPGEGSIQENFVQTPLGVQAKGSGATSAQRFFSAVVPGRFKVGNNSGNGFRNMLALCARKLAEGFAEASC